MIARSLAELLRHKGKVTELYLKRSADLVCNNLFCEKVTKPCLCRLERALEHSNPANLEVLDLSGGAVEWKKSYPEVRDAIAQMFPTQERIELFARGNYAGWTEWGLDVLNKQEGDFKLTAA
jgi:hypothetical protein